MCKLRRITHKLNIKPFTSIKSTKIKCIPIIIPTPVEQFDWLEKTFYTSGFAQFVGDSPEFTHR